MINLAYQRGQLSACETFDVKEAGSRADLGIGLSLLGGLGALHQHHQNEYEQALEAQRARVVQRDQEFAALKQRVLAENEARMRRLPLIPSNLDASLIRKGVLSGARANRTPTLLAQMAPVLKYVNPR